VTTTAALETQISPPGLLKARVQVKQPFVELHSLGGPSDSPLSHLWQGAFLLLCHHYPDEVQLGNEQCICAQVAAVLKRTVPSPTTTAMQARHWPSALCLDGMWTHWALEMAAAEYAIDRRKKKKKRCQFEVETLPRVTRKSCNVFQNHQCGF
jgi:hypothetical protein